MTIGWEGCPRTHQAKECPGCLMAILREGWAIICSWFIILVRTKISVICFIAWKYSLFSSIRSLVVLSLYSHFGSNSKSIVFGSITFICTSFSFKKLLLAFNLITQFYLIFLSLNVKLSKEIFEEHQRLEFWIQGTLITFCMMQTSLVHSLSPFSAS